MDAYLAECDELRNYELRERENYADRKFSIFVENLVEFLPDDFPFEIDFTRDNSAGIFFVPDAYPMYLEDRQVFFLAKDGRKLATHLAPERSTKIKELIGLNRDLYKKEQEA